mmetsp:Transcript_80655/g.216146  ORF Transcript_80655/g.216146 Transcript_80655/m.216146 type:complete len:246 (-) Transcript_80655:1040-1777(-)
MYSTSFPTTESSRRFGSDRSSGGISRILLLDNKSSSSPGSVPTTMGIDRRFIPLRSSFFVSLAVCRHLRNRIVAGVPADQTSSGGDFRFAVSNASSLRCGRFPMVQGKLVSGFPSSRSARSPRIQPTKSGKAWILLSFMESTSRLVSCIKHCGTEGKLLPSSISSRRFCSAARSRGRACSRFLASQSRVKLVRFPMVVGMALMKLSLRERCSKSRSSGISDGIMRRPNDSSSSFLSNLARYIRYK